MYQVLLVEDEQIIRRGIRRGVRWEEHGFQICAEAEDGAEALHIIGQQHIDLMITDIKMPVMNGLELSKKVREQAPHIEIIVLSGYAEFEYAREAISFGAFEYLLKPVKKEKVEEVLGHIKVKLDARKKEEEELLKYMSVYREGLEQLRKQWVIDLLSGERKVYVGLHDEIARLELQITPEEVTAGVLKIHPLPHDIREDNGYMTQYHRIMILRTKDIERCVFIIRDHGEIDILLSGHPDGGMILEELLRSVSADMKEQLFKEQDIVLRGGIGMTYPSITHLYKSCHQAVKAIEKNFHIPGQDVSLFRESIEYEFERQWVRDYPAEMNRIITSVMDGDDEKAVELIGQMFRRFADKRLNSELIKNYCYILGIMLKNAAYGLLHEEDEDFIDGAFEQQIKKILDMDELQTLMRNVFSGMSKFIRMNAGNEQGRESHLIDQAKSYIRAHYKTKISLDDICRELYLSTTYFSYFFKKETGESYMDYLQKIRMEEAGRLLQQTNMKVYEIVEAVGYSDYKYFTQQFRKYTGMTPKSFRNL